MENSLLPLPFPLTKEEIQKFCQQHSIKKLALFGSVLREDFYSDSDVDMLVNFLPEKTPSFFALSDIQDKLSEIAGRTVDLRTPEELSPYFRDRVLAEALVIYDGDR
jgi:predicted nucleotidyltransferase